MTIKVGIGELKVSDDQRSIIKSYALGSCVAVIMYDTQKKIGGLIHIALPESKIDPEKAQTHPTYFADTGVPLLLNEMKQMGAQRISTWIKLAGGANIMDPHKTFDIGRRNLLMVKRILWIEGLGAVKEDVGGNISRTVFLSISTGEVTLSSGKKRWKL